MERILIGIVAALSLMGCHGQTSAEIEQRQPDSSYSQADLAIDKMNASYDLVKKMMKGEASRDTALAQSEALMKEYEQIYKSLNPMDTPKVYSAQAKRINELIDLQLKIDTQGK